MIKTRQPFILMPLLILLAFGSGVILFIVYIIVEKATGKFSDFPALDIMAGTVFLVWIAIFPLIMILTLMRNYVVHADKLEVTYLFGLFRFFYNYDELRISDYSWTTRGVLIQLSNGDQLTLGERQYKNYSEIKESLQRNIKKDKIEVKYTTRLTRIMLAIGGLALLLFLIV